MFLGAALGGVITYLILLFLIPNETERILIFIVFFALISSQIGMIFGGPLLVRLHERWKENRISKT